MKNLILLFTILINCFACTSADNNANTLKIGVISDIHYLSEQLMDNGEAVINYEKAANKTVREVPVILQQVLDDYLNSDIDVLLITGDMTKDGEKQSHTDLTDKLKPLADKGIRIFVIPGNHDINVPTPSAYKENSTYTVDNTSAEEFIEVYRDYGYGDALKRDAASLSYVAELNPSTWLLAIDSNRYKEYTDRTISGGKISQETEEWITEVMREANEKNIQVVGMMHHGLVEHIMMQSVFFEDYIVQDWRRLASLFADLGIKAIFTGHFHANDITLHASPSGNKIYDIETGSLAAYAFPYRFVELSRDGMKISTRNIISTPDTPNLAKNSKEAMEKTAKQLAIGKLKSKGMVFPAETTQLISDIIAKIFVKHLEGDEAVDEELEQLLQQLAKQLDSPFDITQLSKLDFEPADNNVELEFR